MATYRTALFIVRAWVEPGSSRPLRAHIRITNDVSAGFQKEVTLAEVTGVCGEVETWLLGVLAANRAA